MIGIISLRWIDFTVVRFVDLVLTGQDRDINEVARRVDELSDKLNYFVSWSSSVGTWLGVIATVLATVITLLVGIVGFFGLSGYLQVRKIQSGLTRTARKIEDDAKLNSARIEHISGTIQSNYQELEKRIEIKVNFYRYFLLGQLCYDNSDFNEAYRYFVKAADFDPSSDDLNYNIARCLTYRNSIDQAVGILRNLIDRKPDEPKFIRALGLAKRFVAPAEAIALFDSALSKGGLDQRLRASIQNEIGLVHRDQGDFQNAHRCHTTANQYVQNDPVTLYFLGVTEALLDRKPQAIQLIQLAASSAAFAAETQQIKGIWERTITWSSYVAQGQHSEAQKLWNGFSSTIKSEYMKATILSHVKSICDAFKVNRSDVIGV